MRGRDITRSPNRATPLALESDCRRAGHDARVVIGTDLLEGACRRDPKAERTARDRHRLLFTRCRRNACCLRDRAWLPLEKCP